MIRRLRVKFILISMLSLFLVLFVIMGVVNVMNYRNIVRDADTTLAYLAENRGLFPERSDAAQKPPMPPAPGRTEAENDEDSDEKWDIDHDDEGEWDDFDDFMEERREMRIKLSDLSPEVQYESRYFSALLNESGEAVSVDVGRIAAVDESTAAQYAQSVLSKGKTGGFLGDYRYTVAEENGGTRVIFLDCGRSLSTFRTFLLASGGISLVGLLLVFVLITLLSGRIIRPISESYEKQKQFITDAGHEIKTPIAIISADAEVLELEAGESEWIDDIRRQTKRLGDLTNDLIFLSRMEESQPQLAMIDFPLSDVVQACVQSFQGPAKAQNKTFTAQVEPMLSYCGDEKGLRQLVNILLDNAVKYSTENGRVFVSLEKAGKGVRLTVENTSEPVTKEQLGHMFDRFYRGDKSRSGEKAGFGIGLAIAKAVTEAHKGKITATTPDGHSVKITVVLP